MSDNDLFVRFDNFVDRIEDTEIKRRLQRIAEALFNKDARIRTAAFNKFDNIIDDVNVISEDEKEYEDLHAALFDYYDEIEKAVESR